MSKVFQGFRICELLRSRNILVAFELMKSWESSLGLVVQKMYADLMKVMNELHDRNAWIGFTEQVHASFQSCLIVTELKIKLFTEWGGLEYKEYMFFGHAFKRDLNM